MPALTEQGYGPSEPEDDTSAPKSPAEIYAERYAAFETTAEREGAKMVVAMETFERRRINFPPSSWQEFFDRYPLTHPVSPYDV
jgi:hypothetical protein